MVLLFVGINALEAILPSLLTRLAPGRLRGTASGVFSTSQFLGIFVGGTAGGYVLGAGGVAAVSYTVLTVSAVWLLVAFNFRMEASTTTLQGE